MHFMRKSGAKKLLKQPKPSRIMATTIAQATIADKKAMSEYLKHYGTKKIIEKRVDCYLSHNHTVLAKDGDKIVGMIQWLIKEYPRFGVAEFEEVYVLEKYQNKGIGSQLLDFTISAVGNYLKKLNIMPRKIFLFVSKNNTDARGLYEKHGFKHIGEAGKLFSDKEIKLVYVRDL